jgi:hypothetical protein
LGRIDSSHTHTKNREWLVLYCGASTSLGDSLKEYCHARGIKYKTEFFGSW